MFELSGSVIDQTGSGVAFGTIAVYNPTDSSMISGTASDDTGKFRILLKAGLYYLKISSIGYSTKLISNVNVSDKNISSGNIRLQTETQLLNEVEVIAEKDAIEISAEKRVFNVSKSLTSIGGTAESLLRNVPSLTIDENGAASLRNMPTTIYVNGKPTQLTLAQIPANQIESVEVISNPSARYEAAASGGIVNLILKKNRKPGYQGFASVGLGNNSRYDATLNLDWQVGKWNITALYSLNATRNPLNGYVHRVSLTNDNVPTTYFDQNTEITLNNLFQSGRIAVDYNLNEHNVFSIATSVVAGAFNTVSNQQYTYRDAFENLTAYGTRSTVPHNDYTNLGLEFDWSHHFAKKGQELRVLSSFTRSRVSNAGDWVTTAVDVDPNTNTPMNQVGYPLSNRIDGRIIGNQTLFQLDYVHPVSELAKWEFGLRSFAYWRDQQYFFSERTDDQQAYNLLPTYSQDANIRETVNGIYALYSRKLARQFSMEAGVRLEQSSLHGLSRFDGTTFGYNYPSKAGQNLFQSFFPSLSISKKISETSELNLSLSRKVGRPSFRHIFVGIQANDRQNINIGNPKVRPEFVNTAELNYDKIWNKKSGNSLQWLATAYYIYEDHTIKPIVQPLESDSSILVTTFQNVKADIRYGIEHTLNWSVGHLSILANVNAYNVILQSVNFTNELLGYNAKLNVTYRFNANVTAQLSGQRRSRSPQLQGYQKAVNGIDFSLRKAFFKNRANVTFTINDIFNSRRFFSVYDQPETLQTTMNRREVRYYKITLQIPFGKTNSGKPKERKIEQPDIDFSN